MTDCAKFKDYVPNYLEINKSGLDTIKLTDIQKHTSTYQTPPGYMKPVPYIKTEPDTFPPKIIFSHINKN